MTLAEYGLLGLLSFGEQSGYDLSQFSDRSIAFIWKPTRSHIYKMLPRLASLGLASSRSVTASNYPEKHLYRLTPAGKRVLVRWIKEIEDGSDPDVYLLKIFFCSRCSSTAVVGQVSAYQELMFRKILQYRDLERRLPHSEENRLPRRLLTLGVVRCQASLTWADTLLSELRLDISVGGHASTQPE